MYKTIVGKLHNNSNVRLVWYLLDDQAELNFSFFPLSFRYQKKHLTWSDLYITKCFIGLWSETLFQLSWWTEKLSQELELGLGFSSTSSLHLIIILSSKTCFKCNTLVVKYMSWQNSCWMSKTICLTVRQHTKSILNKGREKKKVWIKGNTWKLQALIETTNIIFYHNKIAIFEDAPGYWFKSTNVDRLFIRILTKQKLTENTINTVIIERFYGEQLKISLSCLNS